MTKIQRFTLNSSLSGEYSLSACENSLCSQTKVRHSENLSLPVDTDSFDQIKSHHLCYFGQFIYKRILPY